jgi:hypothetical protein
MLRAVELTVNNGETANLVSDLHVVEVQMWSIEFKIHFGE